MVISVKKENEKLLNLPTITKEILAYCDTEEALENLKEEWSNFKNFRPAIELIENYTIQSEADEDFDLTKETSATKVISNYFDKEKPMKWDDLSDDFKNDYNVILDNLQKHLNKLIFQFKGVSLSYDTHNKKFVFSRKRNESDDYRNFNCLLKGNELENFISTSLLVLVDLTRFSSISNSYKTKVEFIWFKYIFGMAELEEFLKELLVQAKRDSKAKLKSFVNNVEFDGDYSILKECLDVSKLSDQAFYALVRNESDSFIIGYSDLPEDLKVEFVRDVIKRWGHQTSPLSNMLTKKELNDYFSRKEIFDFFKETLKGLLEAIRQFKEKKYNVYYIKVDEKEYIPISGYKPDFKKYLTEDELSELKAELIPILEKIQDEIFVSCSSNVWKHISISNFVNLNEEELLRKIISKLDYGEFLIQVFDLLDWYPNKIKLYKSMDKPGVESLSALESLKRQDLIKIRKSFVDFLSYKEIFDKLKSISVEYYLYEKQYSTARLAYNIKNEDDFDLIIKESLGYFDKFFGYIGKNINKDDFIKINNSKFSKMSSFRADVFLYN